MMYDLFQEEMDAAKNWLPYDGTVHYWGVIIPQEKAHRYYEQLLAAIAWQQDEAIIFGKHILTKRKVAWYADQPYQYTYSKITKTALVWTPLLLELKTIVEQHTQQTYNSCLLNLYHSGEEGMAWHSDGEKDLKRNGSIASLTFGATRKFAMKHKETKEKVAFNLKAGELLEMKDETQQFWLHRLPPTKKVQNARINLTFRQMER